MSEDIQRDLGRFEAQIAALTASVSSLQGSVRELSESVAEAKGGWKTIMILGGAAATIGAFAHKLLDFFIVNSK